MAYKQRWSDFFKNFDANQSGDISMDDCDNGTARFAEWMKFKAGTPEYEKGAEAYRHFLSGFIKAVDTNKDGIVTREEYDQAVEKLVAAGKSGIPDWWRQAAAMLFSAIDTNKNGELSLEELAACTKNVNSNVKDEDIKHAFEWAKSTIGKPIIDSDGFMDLIWIWGSDSAPHPEFDIIFAYWK